MTIRVDLSALAPAGPEVPGWEMFFDGCPVAGWVCVGESHEVVAMNAAAETLMHVNRRAWIGRGWGEFQEGVEVPEWENGGEVRLRSGVNSWVDIKMCVQRVAWQGKLGWHVCGVDVSEKRELEARLLRNQRLECIGMLASGVAHDLNNVLSPMMMAASMLNGELPLDQKNDFVKTIEESAQQGVALLRQVLTFVKGIEGELAPLRLEGVLDEVMRMVRRTFPKSIEVHYVLPVDPLDEVMGHATKLQQVILNLAVNARDVMEQGGVLEVRAENVTLGANDVLERKGLAAGRYVKVTVRDTGPGIEEAIQQKIFKPFFTTKAPEKGSSGLGLTTVLGIVKGHRGWVEVESQPGKGALFVLLLPACPETQNGSTETTVAVEKKVERREVPKLRPELQGGVVLVVDDEPGIRRLVEAILSRQGLEVLVAESGAEALEIYRKRKNNVQAMLVDLMMPGMDGVMLVGALRRIGGEAEVVVSSGAELDTRMDELRALGVNLFLKKPYRAPDLVELISSAIIRSRAGSGMGLN